MTPKECEEALKDIGEKLNKISATIISGFREDSFPSEYGMLFRMVNEDIMSAIDTIENPIFNEDMEDEYEG